ncbi:MAG: hypothetical protein ACXWAX_10890, partial [Chthoniobacterales bacterium]
MDIDLKDNTPESSPDKGDVTAEDSTYRISMQPVVSYGRSENRAEAQRLTKLAASATATAANHAGCSVASCGQAENISSSPGQTR